MLNKKIPNLDALRFFLAATVILFHVPAILKNAGFHITVQFPILNRGLEAVNFFFTLSGFLIIRLLFIEKLNGNIDIGRFYLRRILRIYPLYYLVLVIGIAIYHFILPLAHIDRELDYQLKDLLLAYIFLLPNVFASNHDVGAILNILWSIGLEEQFYLFIPWIIFFVNRNFFVYSLLILLTIYLPVFFYSKFLMWNGFYFFYFLFGGLLSVLSYKFSFNKFFRNKLCSILIITSFVIYFFTDLLYFENKLGYHITAMLLSASFITLIGDYPLFIINNKFLNYLGKISFGIYMYHMIVFTGILFIVRYLFDLRGIDGNLLLVPLLIIEFALTIFLAHISYKYYEAFFLSLKKRFRKEKNNI